MNFDIQIFIKQLIPYLPLIAPAIKFIEWLLNRRKNQTVEPKIITNVEITINNFIFKKSSKNHSSEAIFLQRSKNAPVEQKAKDQTIMFKKSLQNHQHVMI